MPEFLFGGFIGEDCRLSQEENFQTDLLSGYFEAFLLVFSAVVLSTHWRLRIFGSGFLVKSALRNGASGQIFRSDNYTFGARLVGYGRGVCWNR